MTTTRTPLVLALFFAGCAQAHTTDAVVTGIYELMIHGDVEACAPARPIGAMGAVAVIVESGAIDAPVPDAPTTPLAAPRVELAPSSSFHAETNRRLPDCEGAWVHEEWTLLDQTSEGGAFEIAHVQEWQGLASCADPSASMPGAPSSDCASERRLAYTITGACDAPCSLGIATDATIDCFCP